MVRVFPQTVSDLLDLRNGSVFQVFTVHHTTGAASTLQVDQSASGACELPATMTTSSPGAAAGLIKETSPSSGISVAAASGGEKAVTVASGVATGTYTIVVRFSGSGAGIGSSK